MGSASPAPHEAPRLCGFRGASMGRRVTPAHPGRSVTRACPAHTISNARKPRRHADARGPRPRPRNRQRVAWRQRSKLPGCAPELQEQCPNSGASPETATSAQARLVLCTSASAVHWGKSAPEQCASQQDCVAHEADGGPHRPTSKKRRQGPQPAGEIDLLKPCPLESCTPWRVRNRGGRQGSSGSTARLYRRHSHGSAGHPRCSPACAFRRC
mmetsp:Transcript_14347/g.39642  ORF Transcript_14347/g.39642 Transcript_14347/m.39642 type:complete len:213 (+) Transcript_14347:286-924(+)